jgi:hypothetical protein
MFTAYSSYFSAYCQMGGMQEEEGKRAGEKGEGAGALFEAARR